ncbi:MAG: hypothetical protein ACK46D_13400, partial [Roseiflexaceae bacterium]
MRYMTHVLLWCFLVGGIVTWTPTRAYAAPIAAPNIAVTNGGFEDATTPTGWTVVQSRTDLGVTSIAGCATVDNTPYGTLQTYTPVARPAHDNYVLATNTHTAAVTNLVKASGLRSMQLRMTATSSAANSYFVAHGSHMYSSQFNANAGQEVNLEVYGIADNVGSLTSDMVVINAWIQKSDCTTTSIANGALIETSGGSGHFTRGFATVPSSGTY